MEANFRFFLKFFAFFYDICFFNVYGSGEIKSSDVQCARTVWKYKSIDCVEIATLPRLQFLVRNKQ